MSYRTLRARLSSFQLILSFVCMGALGVSGGLMAAPKAERQRAAEDLVKEALHREIYGLQADREQLLHQALQQSPNYAPAMWHLGYVRHQDKWIKADEVALSMDQDHRLTRYLRIRGQYPETAEGQLALADWCRQRGLLDQERAHLTRVLDVDPDHAHARARLGFQRVGGQWMSGEEFEEAAEQLNEDRKALAKWRPEMEKIRHGLRHRSELRRTTAAARILEIQDIAAIPAMELVLSRDSEQAALLVVQAVGNMVGRQASLALARQAVFSPWPNVRQAAVRQLQPRSEDSYIPTLLSAMYTPIASRAEVFRGRAGRLMYRHSFVREGQDQHELEVFDTEYRAAPGSGGDGRNATARALANVRQSIRTREMTVDERNQRTRQLNERIAWVLNMATDQTLPALPEMWWQWWNEENEVYVSGEKPTQSVRHTERIAVTDRGPDQYRMDCLAAGTPVWTAMGRTSIEYVQVGDLVLAQNPTTGELAYKPVLRTTVRPQSRLIRVRAGGETFEASGGHLFWISGEGWVKSRDLQSGMELHGANGPVRVSAIEEGDEEETYNLVVADFHTYFVGESKILCHDNTVHQPTTALVPGLAAQ